MPVTQRKRSFQLFRRMKFCKNVNDDEQSLDIDKMVAHVLDCLGALQCVMGRYDQSRARVFWGSVITLGEVGLDTLSGYTDRRHPGATHLMRAFPFDTKTSDGRSWLPLHWAAVSDLISCEDVRNIARADPLALVKGGNQPISASPGHLIAAVRHPDMKVVKCLYDFYPRMANTRDSDGDLPLHYAARYCQEKNLISFLLQHNPGATKIAGDGDLIPLQCALYNSDENCRFEIAKMLIEADASGDSLRVLTTDGDTVLHLAVDDCNEGILNLLISAYPDAVRTPNDLGFLPLHQACYSKTTVHTASNVRRLLDVHPQGALAPNSEGLLAAHLAAEYSDDRVMEIITEQYPEAVMLSVADYGTPLHQAIKGNNVSTVQFLCRKYPEAARIPDASGMLPIHLAARNDNLPILEIVHTCYPPGAYAKLPDGSLPLHCFMLADDRTLISEQDLEADCLRFLLKINKDAVRAVNQANQTPYSMAAPENAFLHRLLLRCAPELNPRELVKLNYQARRMAMFLAFAAINADGLPTILVRLHEADHSVLKYVVSFL